MAVTRSGYDSLSLHPRNASVENAVRGWFSGDIPAKVTDGRRSISIPHPEKPGLMLKIKGAGYKGGPVQFGAHWNSGPKAPVFDFDGRMMEDVASGHDNALVGGASFQQAAVEYQVSRKLQTLGLRVVPCIGYGRITKGGRNSWFSLFEVDPDWKVVAVPAVSIDDYAEAKLCMGRLLLELATRHRLIGYCWYVVSASGERYLKDFHPFRTAHPVDMSQISWTMQLFFALHIVSLSAIDAVERNRGVKAPDDLQAYPFRCCLPDATKADHEALRRTLVVKYMLGSPQRFDQARLLDTLHGNRITQALMDHCPAEYVRP